MARSDPATSAVAITPNDSTNLTVAARAIYVGTGGTLVLKGWDDVSVTFTNIPNGTILPVAAKRVMATGTTATDLVALV